MATESMIQTPVRGAHPSGHAGHTTSVVVCRDAAGWLHARVADGGGEAVLQVETDERYWRLRRTAGATASMFERALSAPVSSVDVAASLVRWAATTGLSGRVVGDATGAVRVSLARSHDARPTADG